MLPLRGGEGQCPLLGRLSVTHGTEAAIEGGDRMDENSHTYHSIASEHRPAGDAWETYQETRFRLRELGEAYQRHPLCSGDVSR